MKKSIVFYVILLVLHKIEGVELPGLTSSQKCNEYYKLIFLPDLNVYGGVRAVPNQLGIPFMAALFRTEENRKVFSCGGTLISDNFVLTSARCVVIELIDFIRLGDLNLVSSEDDVDAQEFQLAESFVHPSYNGRYLHNDIALIKLDKPAVLTSFVFPVCLLPKQVDISNKDFYVAGWGVTDLNESGSDYLQVAEFQYYNTTKCQELFSTLLSIKPELQICALGRDNRANPCPGDSGGPLVYKYNTSPERVVYYIAGIISFVGSCGTGFPGFFTRVSHYTGWIENIVWPNNN